MRRYLVVANQTLGGRHLAEALRERVAAGDASFHLLVPATHPADHAVWTEGEALTLAQGRLERALEQLRTLGTEVIGGVGDADPMQAIRDVLKEWSFDEIIVSTLPPGLSRWLRQDLPHRIERQFEMPVTHVLGEREPAEPGPAS